MTLTEEQRKRIEENRKRALEIRQRNQQEKERLENNNSSEKAKPVDEMGGFVSANKRTKFEEPERPVGDTMEQNLCKKPKNHLNNIESDGGEESLEDFEQGASEYITKTEAQRVYCLPMGTLAVCSYTERENPHKKGWSKMKLYLRSEVRRRARKRFGGKDGLIEERERRKEKRLEKDLEETKDVFR